MNIVYVDIAFFGKRYFFSFISNVDTTLSHRNYRYKRYKTNVYRANCYSDALEQLDIRNKFISSIVFRIPVIAYVQSDCRW